MPVPAFPENLSKGVVDGGVIPWEIVAPLKVHELADSHTVISGDRSLYNTFFIWAMNKNSYNKLPDDLKAIIDNNSGLEASGWAGLAMEEGDAVGLAAAEGQGNPIAIMSEDVVTEIKAMSDELVSAWVAEMDEKGLPGQSMVDDATALVAEESK